MGKRCEFRLLLSYHTLEPHLRRWCKTVAGRQVAGDVEAAVAGCARVLTGAASDAEGDAVGVCGGADRRVGNEDEGIAFDVDRVSGTRVRVSRFQIKDEIGGCVRTR